LGKDFVLFHGSVKKGTPSRGKFLKKETKQDRSWSEHPQKKKELPQTQRKKEGGKIKRTWRTEKNMRGLGARRKTIS